jgi:hypothetical protein
LVAPFFFQSYRSLVGVCGQASCLASDPERWNNRRNCKSCVQKSRNTVSSSSKLYIFYFYHALAFSVVLFRSRVVGLACVHAWIGIKFLGIPLVCRVDHGVIPPPTTTLPVRLPRVFTAVRCMITDQSINATSSLQTPNPQSTSSVTIYSQSTNTQIQPILRMGALQ